MYLVDLELDKDKQSHIQLLTQDIQHIIPLDRMLLTQQLPKKFQDILHTPVDKTLPTQHSSSARAKFASAHVFSIRHTEL